MRAPELAALPLAAVPRVEAAPLVLEADARELRVAAVEAGLPLCLPAALPEVLAALLPVPLPELEERDEVAAFVVACVVELFFVVTYPRPP